MKRRVLVGSLISLLMALGLAVPAFAGNVKDAPVYFGFSLDEHSQSTEYRIKQNTTKVYFRVDDNKCNDFTRLIVYGAKNNQGASEADATKGEVYLSLAREGKFSITNYVHERGYSHARVYGYMAPETYGYIRGFWSPDSTRNYTVLN